MQIIICQRKWKIRNIYSALNGSLFFGHDEKQYEIYEDK